MALAHSPSIVTDGLVLAYDMSNTGRSWKGAPTTNLVPYPYADWNGSSFALSYNYDATGTHAYTYVTDVSNPVGSAGVMQYTTGTTGYKYWAIRSNVVTTGTHTFSYYARIVNGPASTSNLNNSQLWRSNGVDQAVSGDWNPTYTTEWKRYSTTGPCTAGTTLDYFPIHSGSLTGGYTIQYCGFQLELGTYATPFVAGTRSTTQALLDLTGQNTITATSLTYASNNTFSFNGTSDYITTPLSLGSTDPLVSINMWIKRTANFNGAGYWGLGGGSSGNGINGYTSVENKIGWDLWGLTTFHTGQDYPLNQWVNVCWVKTATTFTTSTLKVYINGVDTPLTTTVRNNSSTVNLATGFNVGRLAASVSLYYAPGDVSVTNVYNRALSATEVVQNFNALRGRYGI